ncbi:hypothetical protein [Halobacteriovorax sp. HLS]|uniref:hypothetical protein n=1 Tax=Halobacteriovorax sp. HLS TaxID=2234000 RepID=UPI000FD6E966|nr:hypothetical protein [Halobacteriovorax sp. HLS]
MHKTSLKRYCFGLVLTLISVNSLATSYATLPKGVRVGGYRHVFTGDITSSYGANASESSYALKEGLTAKTLESINQATKEYFKQLKAINPKAYEDFTFGEYSAQGSGEVTVNGFGAGWGITDRLTAYFSMPIYKANVNLDIHRTQGNNHQQTVQQLNQNTQLSADQKLIRDITAQLPDAKQELLQSVVVNYYNYKPIGNWQGQGLGDVEVGAMYRLTDWKGAGIAIAGGVVLPTGRTDHPDILQDIAFGDGQTDVFAEVFMGKSFMYRRLDLDLGIRYTYQFAKDKEIRIPDSYEFPLSTKKAVVNEKLGNKISVVFGPSYGFTNWFSFSAAYALDKKFKSTFESEYTLANEILAINTDSESHYIKLAANFSTVNLYRMEVFPIPLGISLRAQEKIAGRNTPKHSQYEIDFRFFF